MEPKDRLIFALDVPDKDQALKFINLLKDEVGLFKVGLELFLAEGPGFLNDLANRLPAGFFLDLKLHDIPATVKGAITAVAHGVAMTTIHIDQGPEDLRKLVRSLGSGPKVLGVTVLTSISPGDLEALGYAPQYSRNLTDLVLLKARLAKAAGCAGVVCSGREAQAVKQACGPDFIVVCPGIRPSWTEVPGDDQQRSVTPYQAIRNGADYIVVGRPLRQAPGPVAAARRVVEEIAKGLEER